MGYQDRLNRALKNAEALPINKNTRYILMSDCHRGTGSGNDNFLPNRLLFISALQYYFSQGYHYIELGDGDELWENGSLEEIKRFHKESYEWLTRYERCGRLHMLYGNHDMDCKKQRMEALWLIGDGIKIGLLHGHQADFSIV